MTGQTVSHYQILEKLGEGGMGVVYKALDLTLGRIVALKFVAADLATNESIKQRLMREAKACASLNHPNISIIYEFGEADGRNFIALEYVEGETLQKLLTQKRFEVTEVLEVALQVTNALEAAHKKGITHRDLKSANIMLDVNNRAKILDFGLAKLAQGSRLTQSGMTLGTAAYMSPEQVRGEELDHRSDIYSMGVVLYELLTGDLPFVADYHLAVMYAIVNVDPKPPRESNPAIPPELEAVILKALAKEPEKRYQTSAEMGNELLELQEVLGSKEARKKHGRRVLARPSEKDQATIIEKIFPLRTKTVLKYLIPVLIITVGIAIWLLKSGNLQMGNDEKSKREIARIRINAAMAYYLKDNNPALALKELELAVKSDSSYSLAWSSLAAVNIRVQELDVAIYQSRKAIALDKSNGDAYYNLAYALEEKGELDAALAQYIEAVKIDSTFVQAYSALGNLHIKLDNAREAVPILSTAVRIAPESEYIYLIYKNLGKAWLALEQHGAAIKSLKRSLQLQPVEVPETIYFLAKAYEAAGMKPESIAQWKRYIEIETDASKQQEAVSHLQKLTK
jgi:serine/threonine protein kinase